MRPLGTPKTPRKALTTPQAHRCACAASPFGVGAMLPCAGVPEGCPIGDMTTFSACAVLVRGDAQSPSEARPSGTLATACIPARVVPPPPVAVAAPTVTVAPTGSWGGRAPGTGGVRWPDAAGARRTPLALSPRTRDTMTAPASRHARWWVEVDVDVTALAAIRVMAFCTSKNKAPSDGGRCCNSTCCSIAAATSGAWWTAASWSPAGDDDVVAASPPAASCTPKAVAAGATEALDTVPAGTARLVSATPLMTPNGCPSPTPGVPGGDWPGGGDGASPARTWDASPSSAPPTRDAPATAGTL